VLARKEEREKDFIAAEWEGAPRLLHDGKEGRTGGPSQPWGACGMAGGRGTARAWPVSDAWRNAILQASWSGAGVWRTGSACLGRPGGRRGTDVEVERPPRGGARARVGATLWARERDVADVNSVYPCLTSRNLKFSNQTLKPLNNKVVEQL
jgi:hypothetical protein